MNTTCTDSRKSNNGPILGLTGGIAAGKSSVSALLTELGAKVICADTLAREVVAPGAPALADIATVFGTDMLDADGALDRKRMGTLVFSDPAQRRRLEAILHPRIRAGFAEKVAQIRRQNRLAVIVYDAPLLLEVGADKEVDQVIVVQVDRATQLARVMVRDGLSEAQAAARIDAQMSPEQRLARADHVVDGAVPPAVQRAQLQKILDAAGKTAR